MTCAADPLDIIEAQLDALERAVSNGRIEELDVPRWEPPDEAPPDRDRLVQVLGRIEVTIAMVGEAKRHVVEAQTTLSRRRDIARLYAHAGS